MWQRHNCMRSTRILGGIVTVLLLASCGDDETLSTEPDGLPSDGSSGASAYDGEYVGTEVTEDGQPKVLVEGTELRLRLEDGALTASAGCNSIGGDYTIDDDVLRVGATSMTEMGCDPPRHAQDEWLVEVLSSSPALAATDTGFVLETSATSITFVDRSVAEPDVELVGTTWLVDGYIDGAGPDGATSSAPDNRATVKFDENGFVVGNDGCNGFGYSGPDGGAPTDGLRYEVDGDRIRLTGGASHTSMACPDVDTGHFWAVLSGTITWEIDASRLTLANDDGQGLTLVAES